MKPLTLMIVDDHPLMREALRTALLSERRLKTVCEAGSGEDAVELFRTQRPNLILMDLLMPGMSGLETIRHLVAEDPTVKILVVTSMEDEDKIFAAVQAGALGYFPKTAPRSYLIEAIYKVADGVPYLPTGIAQKLFKRLRTMPAVQEDSTVKQPLTLRQEEILHLMGEGRTDQQISATLHLSEITVRSHIHNILQRLNLETRAQAVAYAHGRKRTET